MNRLVRLLTFGSLALAAPGVAAPAVAGAATRHHRHRSHTAGYGAAASNTSSTTAAGGDPSGSSSSEVALTGATLESASAAALAAVPGTVLRATTETDGSGAYEVIVQRADGTHVKVIEDSTFKVLTTAATACG
jgi:hypothetical protein